MGKKIQQKKDSAIRGLQKGMVEEVQSDPEGKNRILVEIPGFSTGLWAALAAPGQPQQGDEVIVGFLNDDPNNPVILGIISDSALPPPAQSGVTKAGSCLSSPGGMKIQLIEEAEKIVIETPAGNHISLDQKDGRILIEDAHNNAIIMSKTGIVLESSRDISLKASGVLTLEGTTLNLRADGKLKAEGAEAEMAAVGRMVLKASLVTIN